MFFTLRRTYVAAADVTRTAFLSSIDRTKNGIMRFIYANKYKQICYLKGEDMRLLKRRGAECIKATFWYHRI